MNLQFFVMLLALAVTFELPSAVEIVSKGVQPMKFLFAVVAFAVLLASDGCVAPGTKQATGQNLNGFPIDEKCAEFFEKSPAYGGNRALAYAANCANSPM